MKASKALFRTYWVIDCWIFHFSDHKKTRREKGRYKEQIRIEGCLNRLEKLKTLPGRHRMQLNGYKCNTVYRETTNYTNTEPGNAPKPGGSSVTAWECYTRANLFSVNKNACSKSWMYSFLSVSASMISVGLLDHSEYQISTNRPTGKTETTHKSKKTITGLESRAGWLLDTPKKQSCSQKAECGPNMVSSM